MYRRPASALEFLIFDDDTADFRAVSVILMGQLYRYRVVTMPTFCPLTGDCGCRLSHETPQTC